MTPASFKCCEPGIFNCAVQKNGFTIWTQNNFKANKMDTYEGHPKVYSTSAIFSYVSVQKY